MDIMFCCFIVGVGVGAAITKCWFMWIKENQLRREVVMDKLTRWDIVKRGNALGFGAVEPNEKGAFVSWRDTEYLREHVIDLEQKIERLRQYEKAFTNLMAIIDRDGGQAQTGNPDEDLERGVDVVCKLRLQSDAKFIQHIQNHLEPDEFVICKICGKSAKEIIED